MFWLLGLYGTYFQVGSKSSCLVSLSLLFLLVECNTKVEHLLLVVTFCVEELNNKPFRVANVVVVRFIVVVVVNPKALVKKNRSMTTRIESKTYTDTIRVLEWYMKVRFVLLFVSKVSTTQTRQTNQM